MKKIIYLIPGAIIGVLLVFSLPIIAQNVKTFCTENYVFQNIVDFQKGLKNSKGKVLVNDNLKVKGNLTVTGDANIDIDDENIKIGQHNQSSIQADSYLESTDLESALENELAIDLASLLPSTTWTIANTTNQATYHDTIGQITFVDADTLTIDSGRFGAAGLNHVNEYLCAAPNTDITYQILNNKILYLSWTDVNLQSWDAIMPIFASSKTSISLIGSGGCPSGMNDSISTLTKVD